MKKKKINPRNIPLRGMSQADLDKIVNNARDEAITVALNIMLYVLKDKFGFTEEQLRKAAHWMNMISSEISEGRIKMKEIITMLKEEYGVEVEV